MAEAKYEKVLVEERWFKKGGTVYRAMRLGRDKWVLEAMPYDEVPLLQGPEIVAARKEKNG